MTTPTAGATSAVATQGTSALATTNPPSFNLPMLADAETAALAKAVFAENMDGGAKLQLDRFKMPGSGGLAFEVPGPDGEPSIEKELICIIIDYQAINSYYSKAYDGSKNPPDCASKDAKTGEGNPGGICAKCHLNQFGSEVKKDGTQGKGKACQNRMRLALIREGEMLPLLISIPPSTLKNFNTYITRLMSKAFPYYGVITKIKLEKDKSGDGIEYSKAMFSMAGHLTRPEMVTMKQFGESLRPYIRNLDITAEDFEDSAAEVAATGGSAGGGVGGSGGTVGNPGEAY